MKEENNNIQNNYFWTEKSRHNSSDKDIHFTEWKTTRRSFLTLAGAGISSLAFLSACKNKFSREILPYINDVENNNPGNVKWFSSSCNICNQHCSLWIKTIENRPVKIETNELNRANNLGICNAAQASLYELYHSNRLKNIIIKGKPSTTNQAIEYFKQLFEKTKISNNPVFLYTPAIFSPSKSNLIEIIQENNPDFYHVIFDPLLNSSYYNCLNHYFNKSVYPLYDFKNVKIIVGFNSNFLSNPSELKAFSETRKPYSDLYSSFFIQFESNFSVTGAYADKRYPAGFYEQKMILFSLIKEILNLSDKSSTVAEKTITAKFPIKKLAKRLVEYKGQSIILSDIQDDIFQNLILKINILLQNIGRGIKIFENTDRIVNGNITFNDSLKILKNANNPLVMVLDTDESIFSIADNCFEKHLPQQFQLVISSMFPHIIHKKAEIVWPSLHFTEKWDDFITDSNRVNICQSVIEPLIENPQPETLLLIAAELESDYYQYLTGFYKTKTANLNINLNFDEEWINALKNGFLEINSFQKSGTIEFSLPETDFAKQILKEKNSFEIQFIKLSKSRNYNYNPLLQELPEAISKVSWTNCGFLSGATAKELNISDGDIVELIIKNKSIIIPIAVLSGLADNVVVLANEFCDNNGQNFSILAESASLPHYLTDSEVKIHKTGRKTKIIRSQNLVSHAEKSFLPHFELNEFITYQRSENQLALMSKSKSKYSPQWAMVIDLNKCTGCGACVIGCQTENNIPVTGQEEMEKNRELQWLRIDRYFSGPIHSPEVHFIPVMCQHCENAPCEAVCPVGASSHSHEGLNQQNYKRCIGARFCNTNCPYQARKFNFTDYATKAFTNNGLIPLMLNPEVSLREKGVSEKCTFCIQRIQEKKREAKISGKLLPDHEIKTACQQSCPSQAIYFGNIADPGSKVFRLANSKRAFRLLEHKSTKAQVYYLAKVKNNKFLEK